MHSNETTDRRTNFAADLLLGRSGCGRLQDEAVNPPGGEGCYTKERRGEIELMENLRFDFTGFRIISDIHALH